MCNLLVYNQISSQNLDIFKYLVHKLSFFVKQMNGKILPKIQKIHNFLFVESRLDFCNFDPIGLKFGMWHPCGGYKKVMQDI